MSDECGSSVSKQGSHLQIAVADQLGGPLERSFLRTLRSLHARVRSRMLHTRTRACQAYILYTLESRATSAWAEFGYMYHRGGTCTTKALDLNLSSTGIVPDQRT